VLRNTANFDPRSWGARNADGGAPWVPIPIVQVDLDALTDVVLNAVSPGQRVWVEVARQGQVIGVVEALSEAGGISKAGLEVITKELAAIDLPVHQRVADELLPRATVIVPTIGHDFIRLARGVEALLALDYPDFEIILVDNRPDPNRTPLPQFAGEDKVRVLHASRRGASSARNVGIGYATGEFVAFTDDDVTIDPNWLRELGTRFVNNPEVDGIGGLVLPLELRTQPQLWFEEFFGGFSKSYAAEILSLDLMSGVDKMFPYAPGRFGAGCNMAFRLSALRANGGFDRFLGTGTRSRGGEDLARFMRQVLRGGTLAFEPRALVRHRHRVSEREFLTQVFGYGTGLTAMFTALIVRDPRHVVHMIRRLPGGIQLLTKPRHERSVSSAPSYPRRAYLYHLLGLMYGPLAYARSVARSVLKD
jgi:glycosyltransferase involved in cell wall biosynthesis